MTVIIGRTMDGQTSGAILLGMDIGLWFQIIAARAAHATLLWVGIQESQMF